MIKKEVIKGAKEHNLKNFRDTKDKFVVITGLSYQNHLAWYDICEGQYRYVEACQLTQDSFWQNETK